MAPAASRLRSEAGLAALPRRALSQYLRLLQLYPVLTKAATSGILSALGNFLAQMIKKRKKENCSQKLNGSGPLRYATYGAAESLLLPLHGALDPSRGPLGRGQEAPPGPPSFCTGLPVVVLPHHELPGGRRPGRWRRQGEERLLAGAADQLAHLDPGAVHQRQLRPGAVPGALRQPGGRVLVRLPGLPGEVRTAAEDVRALLS
ncbi:peroxisomal membrane protein 2 isoform 2-T4 [Glossophaga mutica]